MTGRRGVRVCRSERGGLIRPWVAGGVITIKRPHRGTACLHGESIYGDDTAVPVRAKGPPRHRPMMTMCSIDRFSSVLGADRKAKGAIHS